MRWNGRGSQSLSFRSLLNRLIAGRAGKAPAPDAFESLEQRVFLSNTPLPTLADMESANDTVVRIETTLGDIDIELFNGAAPITVANFLNYVTSGRYGESFFHRSDLGPPAFVLQGGGFKYDQTAGFSVISTDAAIVRELTGRSNLARTIAMARTGDLNSATDQFFINYNDNTFLDPANSQTGGYTVFAKVIQGWNVVQAIQALSSVNLTADPAFAGTEASNFGTVPVQSTYSSSTGVRERDLVQLIKAEVIKPATTQGFFSQSIVYPEGFRSGGSVESITVTNPNAQAASYQVIIHYETGQRDSVVASGTITANSSSTILLSDFSVSSLNLIRAQTPYSVEVVSAFAESFVAPKPVSATSNRIDFNGATSENFFNPDAEVATGAMKKWDLPRIEHSFLSREFVVWQNLTAQTAVITAKFLTSSGLQTVTWVTEAYRRGGLDLGRLGFADGVMSAEITSTQDIVVSMSDFDVPASGVAASAAYTPAFGVLGVTSGGATSGGIGFAEVLANVTNTISLVNFSTSAASITLTFWPNNTTNSTAITRTILLPASQRSDFDMTAAGLGVTDGSTFAVTYASTAVVSAQYTSYNSAARGSAISGKADGMATTFATQVAPLAFFAGQLDPANLTMSESISIFSPFASTNVNFSYSVRYFFSDGTAIDGASNTLGAHGRVEISTRSLANVLAKINSGSQFHTYGIQVIATGVNSQSGASTPAAGFITYVRNDSTNGHMVATGGMPSGPGLPLTDSAFL